MYICCIHNFVYISEVSKFLSWFACSWDAYPKLWCLQSEIPLLLSEVYLINPLLGLFFIQRGLLLGQFSLHEQKDLILLT